MAFNLPSISSIIVGTVCNWLQHKNCYKFNQDSIQGITSPLYGLYWPHQTGAPNATGWHSFPDLPPQSILTQTERSTVCLLSFSITFVLKNFWESLCTSRTNHAIVAINSSSPSDLVAHGDHLDVLLHQKNPLFKSYLQDIAVHQVIVVGRDVTGVYRIGTSRTLIQSSIPFY
jgi:hypothetical protein